jgi:hypothetical protein
MIHPSQGTTFQGKMNGETNSETNGNGDRNQEQSSSPRRRDLMAGSRPKPIVPKSLSEAYRIAQAVCAAKMAPKGLDTPEACMIAIMHGLELGLSPLSALQRIAVINGRPTIWGDGALAIVKASGFCEAIEEWIEGDKHETLNAVCNVMRRGDIIPVERRFSVEDAKRAKLWGKPGPWSDYPKRMLQMRARAFALRDAFPDVLGGLYLTEEWMTDHDGATDTPSVGAATAYAQKTAHAQKPGRTADDVHEHPATKRQQIEEALKAEDKSTTARTEVENDIGPPNLLNAKLPPIANLHRARRMPRASLALRFQRQWSIKQPKHPASPLSTSKADGATLTAKGKVHSPEAIGAFSVKYRDSHSPSFIPQSDYEACLDLFDAALCCANDQESLIEIVEEFSERLHVLPQTLRQRSDAILEKHNLRIEHAVGEQCSSWMKTNCSEAKIMAACSPPTDQHEDAP